MGPTSEGSNGMVVQARTHTFAKGLGAEGKKVWLERISV